MNTMNPVDSLWLGKIQMEMGVLHTNLLRSQAENEALRLDLTNAFTAIEALKQQVADMAMTNTNLRNENQSLREEKPRKKSG